MDFSNVDIEEVGFDRPCTKDVHGSLGSLDIQLCAFTGVPHTEWPPKGAITPLYGLVMDDARAAKADMCPVMPAACDSPSLDPATLDILVFHKWGNREPIFLKGVSESNYKELVPYLKALENAGEDALDAGEEFVAPKCPFELRETTWKTFILTCAHVTRDMRCGYCGSKLHDLITEQIEKRDLKDTIYAGRVTHIGGHVYAGNVLVYPEGVWYGYMRPADVPRLFDEHLDNKKLLLDKLRGKMGLSKTENLALLEKPQ